jgi:hypothetical protein
MFQRVVFGSTTKTTISEEQLRSDLTGYYDDLDATIRDMKTNPSTPIKKNDVAVYWYGM